MEHQILVGKGHIIHPSFLLTEHPSIISSSKRIHRANDAATEDRNRKIQVWHTNPYVDPNRILRLTGRQMFEDANQECIHGQAQKQVHMAITK